MLKQIFLVMIKADQCTSFYYSLIPEASKIAKFKAADFALFASAWWPKANFRELRIAAFLAIWLFVWDDEIDEMPGALSNDFESAQHFREETTAFVKCCLGLSDSNTQMKASSIVIESFRDIGNELCSYYTVGKELSLRKHSFILFIKNRLVFCKS